MKQQQNFFAENQSFNPSFDEILQSVKEQIDYDCFAFAEIPQAHELACIITEVLRMRPGDKIRVEGALRSVSDVQCVYARLTCEHLRYVLQCFNEIPYFVHNPKHYLRTALYNSVFTMENRVSNQYATDGGAP